MAKTNLNIHLVLKYCNACSNNSEQKNTKKTSWIAGNWSVTLGKGNETVYAAVGAMKSIHIFALFNLFNWSTFQLI